MAGEQPVFLNLSPDESLTNVHERLKQIPAQRIVLIVPQQTQLRSLISWRLLRGYARELNKEILVISADRQIRSVAKEAQFRVAESLAVPPSSKGGRGSNPVRSGTGATRGSGNRGGKGLSRFRQAEPPQQNRTSSRRGASGSDQRGMRSPLRQQPPEEQETNEPHISNLGEDDEPANTGWAGSPSSDSQYGEYDEYDKYDKYDAANRYNRPIDFRAASNSPVRPVELTPEPEEEELEDSLPYNYEQTQKIFQAAQPRQKDEDEDNLEETTDVLPGHDRMVAPQDKMVSPAPKEQTAQENIPQERRRSSPLSASFSPSAQAPEDPFDVVNDFQPSPLSEQRGAVPFLPFDEAEDVADISEYPTSDVPVHGEIEDMGDVEMDDLPPASTWEETEPEEDAEPEQQQVEKGTAAATFNVANTENAAQEKDIEDEPTRVIPPMLTLPDAVAGQSASRFAPEEPAASESPVAASTPARRREPKPVELQQTRAPARPRQAPGRRRTPVPPPTKGARPVPRSRKPLIVTKRKQSRVGPVLIAVAVLLIAGIILFIVPSADVTVTLAAKSYSWPVVVSASTSTRQNLAQRTVPLYSIPFTAHFTQKGNASGANTPVGTKAATGLVQFTNHGNKSVLIPEGTVVSTADNVLFATTAELLVTPGYPLPVPVQAQAAGSVGNVAANTITVIPTSSLTQIQQVKENQGVTVTASTLSVTNQAATSGGGTGSATTVTKNDVSNLQSSANKLLYKELQTWLIQKKAQGYILASPVQESQLASNEKVTATPAAGQVASSGTFSETVVLSLPVKFVRSGDLQAQAVAQYHQLSSSTPRPPKGYEPVAGQPVQLTTRTCPSSAHASTLCFTATAPVALPITTQQVQNLVNGRQVKVVRAELANSKTGLAGIKKANVVVHPGFWPWMPFWTQRISVHFTTEISQK